MQWLYAPEYAIHGKVSVKSDVFSFGVLILEILSGKKNRSFGDPNQQLNLLGYVSKQSLNKNKQFMLLPNKQFMLLPLQI